MKIKLLILFLFIALAAGAQEVVFDTIIISKPDSVLLLTHYEKLSDGRVRGKIGGLNGDVTFPVPDTATIINYIVGQMIQKANDHSDRELKRMPLKELTDYLNSTDSLLIKSFGKTGRTIIRDAYKPLYLSYTTKDTVINGTPRTDTSYQWRWRLLRTGGVNEDVQFLERFSTKVVRLVRSVPPELVVTINSDRSIFINGLDGISRLVFHLAPNGEYISFDEARRITYRLVRRLDSRASAQFRQQFQVK
jgi:hypothetical protein